MDSAEFKENSYADSETNFFRLVQNGNSVDQLPNSLLNTTLRNLQLRGHVEREKMDL